MRRYLTLLLLGPLAVTLAAGCDDAGDGRVLGISTTGAIVGTAYLDRDGNGQRDAGSDAPVPGLIVGLAFPGARDTIASVTTDEAGRYAFGDLEVGSYELVIDASSVPDTLEFVATNPARITVAMVDTPAVTIALGYPHITLSEARTAAAGRRVAVHGVALNDYGAFGDATVHLSDAMNALRAVGVAASAISAGDSVRIVGTLDRLAGQPVLSDAFAFVLGASTVPAPETLSTAAASTARSGARDAALVRIEGATVLDVRRTSTGDDLLIVDDGSGALEVILDTSGRFGLVPLPGAIVESSGLLVPSAERAGRWSLKPRSTNDLSFEYPSATLREVRSLEPGKRVAVEGVALNGWATFGDATVHLADRTGALRTIRVAQANLFAGDSVRVIGTVAVLDGQPVLSDATASILAAGTAPAPRPRTTAQAARAAGGLDAALVQITNATVTDTATTAARDFLLTVNDGSGAVQVLIDQDTGIQRAPYVPNARIDAIGVLVPLAGGGGWMLKPRTSADLRVR